MSAPVGGARAGRDRDRWERRMDKMAEALEERVRKLERSVWTLSAVLATTTLVAIINLVRAAAGVQQ